MAIAKKEIILSLLIIGLGSAWLVNSLGIDTSVDWIWVAGLGFTGMLILAFAEADRLTFVTGPFLIVASLFSVLRQKGFLNLEIEVPLLTIVFGVCLLCVHVVGLPRSVLFDVESSAKEC